jgi:deoxyribose-phosphate aldolase
VIEMISASALVALLDLTTLNDNDTVASVRQFAAQCLTPVGPVACVCVYPQFVVDIAPDVVRKGVRVATVINFPDGEEAQSTSEVSIKRAIADGAHEIDVVMPRSSFLQGDDRQAQDFLRGCRAACGNDVLMKVILETGALSTADQITRAAQIAIDAGADFLKTSTGKMPIGATTEAVQVLCDVVSRQDRPVGLKFSGGVRTLPQVHGYLSIVKSTLGESALSKDRLRIGASHLLSEILSARSV